MVYEKADRKDSQDIFFVQSIDRALRLVDTISKDGNEGLTLLELASRVELPTSTVYRLLQNLLNWNYVSIDKYGKYTLGLVFLSLGHQVGEGLDLVKISEPYLDSLNKISGETIYLTVYDEKEKNSLYIGKRSGSGNIRLVSTVGAHNGVYCSANGKALLFTRTIPEIYDILSDVEMVPKTKNTITDIDTLIEDVCISKKRGYTIDMEESEYSVACLGAPVMGSDGKVIAAVSISGLVSNITPPQRFRELAKMLLETTRSISLELGYTGLYQFA